MVTVVWHDQAREKKKKPQNRNTSMFDSVGRDLEFARSNVTISIEMAWESIASPWTLNIRSHPRVSCRILKRLLNSNLHDSLGNFMGSTIDSNQSGTVTLNSITAATVTVLAEQIKHAVAWVFAIPCLDSYKGPIAATGSAAGETLWDPL